MAVRVTEEQVRGIIATNADISVVPFITAANTLTDRVSANDSNSLLSSADLEQIELYLAAFFYALRDQQYREKKTGGASAVFQVGGEGKGFLDQNDWGKTAMALDATGYLSQMNNPRRYQIIHRWLGKPLSEQVDYEDRD